MEPELVGVRAAADLLGLSPSTISRNVTAGIIPNHGTDDKPLIDIEEAREARERELDPSKRGNSAGKMTGELEAEAAENSAGESHSPGEGEPSLLKARVAREGYDAMRSRLAYEREAGLVVRKDEVERAHFDAGRTMRDAGMRLAKKVAPEFAAMSDPAEIERRMNEEMRVLFAGLAEALQQQGDS